jgi:hypothetical protein
MAAMTVLDSETKRKCFFSLFSSFLCNSNAFKVSGFMWDGEQILRLIHEFGIYRVFQRKVQIIIVLSNFLFVRILGMAVFIVYYKSVIERGAVVNLRICI